jgi:hypothetical protein
MECYEFGQNEGFFSGHEKSILNKTFAADGIKVEKWWLCRRHSFEHMPKQIKTWELNAGAISLPCESSLSRKISNCVRPKSQSGTRLQIKNWLKDSVFLNAASKRVCPTPLTRVFLLVCNRAIRTFIRFFFLLTKTHLCRQGNVG